MPLRCQRNDVPEHVETVAVIDGVRLHRFQIVREHLEDGGVAEWIVVGLGEDDAGDEVRLADRGFQRTLTVPYEAFRSGRFVPVSAGGVPRWGY